MNRLIARFDVAYPAFHLDVDLDVPATGITAIFGQSGSGKTTLLRCMAGLERSPTGFMRIGEEIWQDESRGHYLPIYRRPIGYVFQEPRLFPHLSVESNLTYGFKRIPREEHRVSLEQVIEVLGIAHLLDRRPQKLSGGEQQRVAIGRALLTSPRLLLLDEPLSSLDTQRKRELLPFIHRLYRELQIPIIYVSHSLTEILRLAHVVALIKGGKILTTGSLNEVFSRLDLHRHLGQQPIGAVIDGRVVEHEPKFGLTRLDFKGQSLYVPLQSIGIGEPIRVHVLSSDVSLVLGSCRNETSALNILQATIVDITQVDAATADVRLDIGCPLVASLTNKSVEALALKLGQRVCAHIKSIALNEELID